MTKLHPIKIRIQNFQSIDDLEFEVYGLTVLVGRSNIGKSAVVRAITAALTNSSIVGMTRTGKDNSVVSIKTNGFDYEWEKGNKTSCVINGKEYKKIGQKQLDEVANFGYGSVRVGQRNIYPWSASQFDPIFLLNDPGPAVTEFISEVSRLNILQNGINISLKKKKDVQDKIRSKSDDLKVIRTKLENFSEFGSLDQIKSDLKDQAHSIRFYEDRITTGEKFVEKLDIHAKVIRQLNDVQNINNMESVQLDHKNYSIVFGFWTKIENYAKTVISLRPISKVNVPNLLSEEFKNFKAQILLNKYEVVKQNINSLSQSKKTPDSLIVKKAFDDFNNLKIFSTKIKNIETDIKEKLSYLLKEEKELKKIQSELGKIPSCPTCNRPIGVIHDH